MRRLKRTFTVIAMLIMAINANAYRWQSPYAYCNNNPVKFIDPDGRKTVLFATKFAILYELIWCMNIHLVQDPGALLWKLFLINYGTLTFIIVVVNIIVRINK